ncbi:MAG: AmmeMemoRadiSam system protein A [Spirochaetaceae bacterium]
MIVVSQPDATALLDYGEAYLSALVTGSPHPAPPEIHLLDLDYGLFATLRGREGALRGCIGEFAGAGGLGILIPRVIRDAALADPRFEPVGPGELGEITLSLSLLSPIEPVSSYTEIELGRHGLLFTLGGRRALFLPEVAGEQAWDLVTTLEMLTRKAGAPRGSWRSGQARFGVFETVRISRRDSSRCAGVLVEPSGHRLSGCAETWEEQRDE